MSDGFRQRPVADRVDRDGECVVLVGDTVTRLSALATHLLDLCADWADAETLAGHLVDRFGAPPDGTDPRVAVESAADLLVVQGLLERR